MPSAVRPTNVARVTMLMQSNLLMSGIRTNSVDLLKAQNQLTTGLRLGRPSDNPAEATAIMNLDGILERESQYIKNIDHANNFLSVADTALGEAVSLIDEAYAQALAGANSGGVAEGGHSAMAEIVDGILGQLVTTSNASYLGSHVFGGQQGTATAFESFRGGVLFNGSLLEMGTQIADGTATDFSIDADEAFGVVSSEVVGIRDLNPDMNYTWLLSDLNGATSRGIRLGSIIVSDGTTSTTVDLSGCVTVKDVYEKITAETPATTTASIAGSANSLEITSTVGTVTVTEVGTGTAAHDLGIFDDVGVGGMTLSGQDVDARITPTTLVSALNGGTGIDTTNGMLIENSLVESIGVIDLSSASTVQDILNTLNHSGLGIRAEINEDGDGINVFNLLSGSELTIAENGGTTATDLGIRSLHQQTNLSDLNNGEGVVTADAVIRVQARDGTNYSVALDTAQTVRDVIDLINAQTGCVLDVDGNVTASGTIDATMAATGNGIELTDNTGGAGDLSVTTTSQNNSFVAADLGLNKSVSGAVLTGDDVNPVKANGLFSNLIALRDALSSGDVPAIVAAGEAVKVDQDRLIAAHGQVGSQVKALEDRRSRVEDNMLALETLRSDIRDIDFTEAITNYNNLYTALQASLQTGGVMSNTSLLDFLS